MSVPVLRTLTVLRRYPSRVALKGRNISTSSLRRDVGAPKSADKKPFWAMGPITWKSLACTTIVGAGVMVYAYYLKQKKDMAIERERRRFLGKASIGGKFELVNPEGTLVKSDEFLGQWTMIYFGFTHCPDVCPDEIEKMVNVVNTLEKEHNFKVQPIFISVDPDRDSPTVVGKYCREFSDKIIGLTGNAEQVGAACKAYRVYFSNGPKDNDNDYIVDHTIIMYLVDPEGLFVDYYGQTQTVDQIVTSILLNKLKLEKIQSDSWLPEFPFKSPAQAI